ncbi:MAG: hypothetical protein CMI02_13820 [Oceanospirillaceae bacterium]|nr:hypothetical protein [Oceanospirillaceae bacterium]MBT13101.1 hypothetical protein [Oceanospirillaceae bacterium]|tara:strand:- start:11632 stop:12207 length:576 start_codon:yes stop_codon:yes gene_type:complete
MKASVRLYLIPLMTICLALLNGCSLLQQPAAVELGSGDVNITVPSTIKVIAVDTREINAPSLYAGSYQLRLPAGVHTLLLRYEENWNSMEDSGHIIRSAPIEIRTKFVAGEKYRLQHSAMSSRRDAEQWVQSPDIRLTSVQGDISGKVIHGPVLTTSADTDVLESLQSLWRAATPEDQARFREWMQQHSNR